MTNHKTIWTEYVSRGINFAVLALAFVFLSLAGSGPTSAAPNTWSRSGSETGTDAEDPSIKDCVEGMLQSHRGYRGHQYVTYEQEFERGVQEAKKAENDIWGDIGTERCIGLYQKLQEGIANLFAGYWNMLISALENAIISALMAVCEAAVTAINNALTMVCLPLPKLKLPAFSIDGLDADTCDGIALSDFMGAEVKPLPDALIPNLSELSHILKKSQPHAKLPSKRIKKGSCSHMKQKSRLRLIIGRLLLVFMLALPMTLPAQEAHAMVIPVITPVTDAIMAALKAAQLALNALMGVQMELLNEAVKGISSVVMKAAKYASITDIAIANEQNDVATHLERIGGEARAAMNDPKTVEAYYMMCRRMRLHELQDRKESAAGSLAKSLQDGWSEHPQQLPSGDGPAYIKDSKEQGCGAGTNKWGGYGNPMVLDPTGVTASSPWGTNPNDPCLPQKGTEAQKRARINADIKVSTITPYADKAPLEKPKDDKPDSHEQVMYTAGRDYCYNAASVTIRPPRGKELETIGGQKRMAVYKNCMALKHAFMGQCFKQLAYVTRPNCEDSANKDECEEDYKACRDAEMYGVKLGPSFGNCQGGEKALASFSWNGLTRAFA